MGSGHTYRERNATLAEMGYGGYSAYLASPQWKSIRRRILRDHPRCRRCSGAATQVHHTDYTRDTLAGECLSALVPICRDCHERIEFRPDGSKRPLLEANAALAKPKRKKPKKPKPKREPGDLTSIQKRRAGAVLCAICRSLEVSARASGVCKHCQPPIPQPAKPVNRIAGLWDLVPKPAPITGFTALTTHRRIFEANKGVCQACHRRTATPFGGLCRKCHNQPSGPGQSKHPVIERDR